MAGCTLTHSSPKLHDPWIKRRQAFVLKRNMLSSVSSEAHAMALRSEQKVLLLLGGGTRGLALYAMRILFADGQVCNAATQMLGLLIKNSAAVGLNIQKRATALPEQALSHVFSGRAYNCRSTPRVAMERRRSRCWSSQKLRKDERMDENTHGI